MSEPDAAEPAPLISVVVPVYNGAALVGRALASVRAQTFAGWECVVVDDGSTDDSAAVIEAVAAADPRVRLIRLPANRGVSAARNAALAAVRGAWVAYLDHDDEFALGHLERIAAGAESDADVLVFRYDLVEERPGHPRFGATSTHDPARVRDQLLREHIAIPLGVAHRRAVAAHVGGFDARLRRDEDSELWRRFAAAGAAFAFVPETSGRYHVRTDSLSRTEPLKPPLPPRPAPTRLPWQGGRPRPASPEARAALLTPSRTAPRVLFASYHCYHDPASGAAVCTHDLFAALAQRGWRCGAFTGPQLDDPAARPIGATLRDRAGVASASGSVGASRFTVHTVRCASGIPVTTFAPEPPAVARPPSPDDAAGFLTVLAEAARRFRPDVVLTYGGDPASRGALHVAQNLGAKAVFWLHNFAYTDPSAFAGCDAVVVPSEFSRRHHQAALGITCVTLPPVIDVGRVWCEPADDRRFVTFVNPVPEKGLLWFARLAEVLGRTRPDIPLLVVEGRGRADGLAGCGIDLRGVTSLHHLANTPDPRAFYRLTRLLLVPSVWRESFGRVAAEAMLNGIPVVASDRGALPEVVAAGGCCLPIPAHVTPESRAAPTADEVAPWVDAILALWDHPPRYAAASAAARAASKALHADSVVPIWEQFLRSLVESKTL